MNEIGGDRLVVQCQRPVLHKPGPAVQCLLDGAVFGLVAAALGGYADNAAGGVLPACDGGAVGQTKARAAKTPDAIEPVLSRPVGDARLCDVNISGCLQSLAEGAIQYSQLDARHWTEGNRTVEYAYDDNGSLTSKVTSVTSSQVELERIEYTYNLQNRLVEVRTSTDEGQSWSVVEYKYDPDGNRVAKVVDGITTDYLIDAYNHTDYSQVFVETTGTDRTAYIIADDVLAQATGDAVDAPKYLLYDGHGSTRQLSNSTGNLIADETYSYDAYGVMLGGNPTAPVGTNLLYTGEYFDANAQRYYLRARYYDPLNGRFNRTDPYAGSPQDPQSLHKYLYCHANPINAIDPSGQFSLTEMLTVATIVGTVIGAVAGTVTLVAGGSAREALWQATEWFWMSFAITAAVYAAVWAGSVVWAWLFGAGAASPTVKQAAEQGFGTSDALRAEWIRMGADPVSKIHHFVQQTPRNIANFGKQAIHSVLNSVPMPKCFHDMITNFQNSGPNTLGLDPAKYGGVSHMYQFIECSNWETQYRWGTAMYNHVMEYGTMGGFDPTRYGL